MMVAGELSGDILGAGLMKTLKQSHPDIQFIGIGGPLMLAEGLESLAPLEQLSIMGLIEVLKHLPALLALRKKLVQHAISAQITAYIGIDAPDFNIRCARTLKKAQQKHQLHVNFKTIHYVSPSIWVWREGRVHGIKKAVDCVLCLFPFEVDLYHRYGVHAVCVGHRLADDIPLYSETEPARRALGLSLDTSSRVIALLPGSRVGEVTRLIHILLAAVTSYHSHKQPIQIVIPAATPNLKIMIDEAIMSLSAEAQALIFVIEGQARLAMQASDVVLLASGTASLEAMLLKKPMVVVYKFNAVTAWLAPKLCQISLFALPNILAKQEIVPELFQNKVTIENMHQQLDAVLMPERQAMLVENFLVLHQALKCDADQTAARAVLDLIL